MAHICQSYDLYAHRYLLQVSKIWHIYVNLMTYMCIDTYCKYLIGVLLQTNAPTGREDNANIRKTGNYANHYV